MLSASLNKAFPSLLFGYSFLDITINLAFLQKHFADQGRKALFALYYKCKHLSVNSKPIIHRFDTYITSYFVSFV